MGSTRRGAGTARGAGGGLVVFSLLLYRGVGAEGHKHCLIKGLGAKSNANCQVKGATALVPPPPLRARFGLRWRLPQGPHMPLKTCASADFRPIQTLRPLACAVAVLATLASATAWAQNYPITQDQRATPTLVAESGVPLHELAPNAPHSHTLKP